MAGARTRPAPRPSFKDIEGLPEHLVGEIIAGELVVSPRPAPRHARAASRLGAFVLGPYELGLGGPGGWHILDEPELRLGLEPDFASVVPDIGGWRVERMPQLPEDAYFSRVPDWVCEVLSPRTAATDRAEKLPFYARAGVGHAWLLDPLGQTLEVYRLESGAWRVAHIWRGNVTVRAEPFTELALDLGLLWDIGKPPEETEADD